MIRYDGKSIDSQSHKSYTKTLCVMLEKNHKKENNWNDINYSTFDKNNKTR